MACTLSSPSMEGVFDGQGTQLVAILHTERERDEVREITQFSLLQLHFI